MDRGLLARLAAIDPNLVRPVNPASPYFRNAFETLFCNFVVGLAIVCQPHALSKAPLLARERSDRAALRFGRVGLGLVAAATVLLAWWQLRHPTGGTVAIFAHYGVYLLFSASFLPLACGMFVPRAGKRLVAAGVASGRGRLRGGGPPAPDAAPQQPGGAGDGGDPRRLAGRGPRDRARRRARSGRRLTAEGKARKIGRFRKSQEDP